VGFFGPVTRARYLLICWAALVGVQIVTPLWYATPDACGYLSIARSLTSGEAPTYLGSRNLVFGIGYPTLIAPAFLFSATPFLLVTTINAALAAIYLAGVVTWARRHAGAAAWPIAIIAVANIVVLALFRRALSEAAFMAAMIWFVVLLPDFPRPPRRRDLAAAAVLLIALVLVRPTGILFGAGWALVLAYRVRARTISFRRAVGQAAVVIVPAALILAAALAYSRAMEARENAVAWSNLDVFTRSARSPATDFPAGPLAMQCVEGLRVRISEVGRLTIPGMFASYGRAGDWRDPNLLVYLPLFVCLGAGWWKAVRRRPDAYLLTFPLYFALHVYWPFNQGGRYFAPLLPLFLLCFWRALDARPAWRWPLVRVMIAAHLAVALGQWLAVDRPAALRQARDWADIGRLSERMRTGRGVVQMSCGNDAAQLQLAFLLDRSVRSLPESAPVDADVGWLVLPSGAGPPDGFASEITSGPYQLLRRASACQPSPESSPRSPEKPAPAQ
jgi:hypothetical protein